MGKAEGKVFTWETCHKWKDKYKINNKINIKK